MAKRFFLNVVILLVFLFCNYSFGSSNTYRMRPEVSYSGRFVGNNCLRNENGIKSQNGLYQVVPQSKRKVNNIAVSDVNVISEGVVLYKIKDVYSIPQVSNTGCLMAQTSPKRNGLMPNLKCYNNRGNEVITKAYPKPVELYGFNRNGTYYGVGTSEGTEIINCNNGIRVTYKKGYNYTISDDGKYVVIASLENSKNIVTIYKNNEKVGSFSLSSLSVRQIDISVENDLIAIVDRDNLTLIKLSDLAIVKKHSLSKSKNISFVDVLFGTDCLWAGLQKRNSDHSKFQGVLNIYDLKGNFISSSNGASREKKRKKMNLNIRGDEFPWPFEPQNKAHTVWNSYLGITGSSNSSSGAYLHQGLDIDVPANEPTVSVSDGFCKARLYIMDPSYLYWRVCIADEDVNTQTEGWMYAHLVENTITVYPDDEVITGQVLGEIIKWDALSSGWNERGHIHFSRISDHGAKWSYTDDQWKNVCDPLTLLRPFGDTIPPQFLDAGNGTAFKFSTNEGSGYVNYLQSNDLSGKVDIIVKMNDHVGSSKWLQPASKIYWWIKRDSDDEFVHPRTIGLIRNQTMPNYTGSLYTSILPPIMHRMDYECGMYSSWTTANRTYHHIITNNDGDSTVEESDKFEALDTRKFNDDDYWIFVELQDAAGNIAIDSILVTFNNGIVSNNFNIKQLLQLKTNIKYSRDVISINRPSSNYNVKVYNARGVEILHKSTKSKIINIDRNKMGAGLYIFRILQKSKVEDLKVIIN